MARAVANDVGEGMPHPSAHDLKLCFAGRQCERVVSRKRKRNQDAAVTGGMSVCPVDLGLGAGCKVIWRETL